MADFQDRAGNPILPTLGDDGAIAVSETSAGPEEAVYRLDRLAWEIAELRRVYCMATGMEFREYPGPATY